MGKAGRLQTQQPVQVQLPRRGGKQVCPAHHLGDAHAGIIHHHRQLIGKHPVCPAQVEIAAVPQQVLRVGAHAAVRKGDGLVRHHQAIGRGFLFALFRDLFRRQPPAGARVDDVAVRGVGCAGGVQLGAGAKAGVYQPHLFQFAVALGIDVPALALVIGRVCAAGAAALVPRKPQPRKVLLQQVGVDAGAALGVQILDAQHDAPALTFCAEPCQQAARQIAQMQPSAGAGRKAPGDRAAGGYRDLVLHGCASFRFTGFYSL